MVPVYICDDNLEAKKYLARVVENIIMIQGYDMKMVLAAGDPEEVLAHKEQYPGRAVYFLDVDLQNEQYNGFTLAKRIRELDPRGYLVFVTTHEEMIYETFRFRLEAMNYLIKDEPAKLNMQIRECLDEINRLISCENRGQGSYYTVKAGEGSYQVPLEDIIYFETTGANHRIILHAKNRVLEFRGYLNTIEEEVGSGFLKVHRSYLIQLDKIEQIHYAEQKVIMNDGSICLLSRKGKRMLKEYFERAGEDQMD